MSKKKRSQGSPVNRLLASGFITVFFLILGWVLASLNPLTVASSYGFLKGLYPDLPVKSTNWPLTILLSLIVQIIYLALVFTLAYYEEYRGNLPSWNQIFFPYAGALIYAFLLISINVDTVNGSNLTGDMKTIIMWTSGVLGVLWMFYFYYSQKE